MATKRWVVNASPLILLGKTDNLDLLAGLADEIGAKPDGARVLEVLTRNSQYAVVQDEAVAAEILAPLP